MRYYNKNLKCHCADFSIKCKCQELVWQKILHCVTGTKLHTTYKKYGFEFTANN